MYIQLLSFSTYYYYRKILYLLKQILFIYIINIYIYNINIIITAFLQLSTYYLQMNVRLTSPSSIYLQINTHNGDIRIGE